MQNQSGLVNQTPKTQVERPGPVFMMMAIMVALVALCILSAFIFFFAKNAAEITPVPTPTATINATEAANATNVAGSPAPNGSATVVRGAIPTSYNPQGQSDTMQTATVVTAVPTKPALAPAGTVATSSSVTATLQQTLSPLTGTPTGGAIPTSYNPQGQSDTMQTATVVTGVPTSASGATGTPAPTLPRGTSTPTARTF